MIKFENLNKSYKKSGDTAQVFALKQVSLEVKPGDIFGIIGTSGAGKSTLLRMANKLEQPDNGSITVDGYNIDTISPDELKKLRQRIGMVFQHFNLLNSLNVYQNIIFPLTINNELKSISRKELDNRVQDILELTGLTDLVDQYPNQLSGGQKQRVAIARSLITQPKILLCDECTSALDPETTQAILQLLKKINQDLGVTILLITHEMEVIKSICNNVAVMSYGKIVETGSVLELYTKAKHDITKKLLAKDLFNKLPKEILSSHISNDLHDNGQYTDDNSMFPLLQLAFIDEVAAKPVLSNIVREFDLNFNILQGEIETIQGTIVGRLIVQLEASQGIYNNIKQYFSKHNINVEIIGYAARIY